MIQFTNLDKVNIFFDITTLSEKQKGTDEKSVPLKKYVV